jgi:hypothetical protein
MLNSSLGLDLDQIDTPMEWQWPCTSHEATQPPHKAYPIGCAIDSTG